MTADPDNLSSPARPMPTWLVILGLPVLLVVVLGLLGPVLLRTGVIVPHALIDANVEETAPSTEDMNFTPENRDLVRRAADEIDPERLRGHIAFFAGLGSRVPGYPGADKAADYIRDALGDVLGEVAVEEFDVVSPLDLGASLSTPEGDRVPLFGLWPNDVKPNTLPADGVEGTLVYCAGGLPADYNGKVIERSIVVLDFDSANNWQLARELGAKAVLFVAREPSTGWQARAKISGAPVDAPRFYVGESDTERVVDIAARGARVRVKANMRWDRSRARNLYVTLEPDAAAPTGEKPPEPIVFHAYYDSMSVVPALAPGAEESCGIAVLLELARVLAQHRSRINRPVLFLATSAHDLALAGEADWCYRHFNDWPSFTRAHESHQDLPYPDDRKKPIPYALFMSFDISSGDARIAVRAKGGLTGYPQSEMVRPYGKLFEKYAFGLAGRGKLFLDAAQSHQREPRTYFPPKDLPLAIEVPAELGLKVVQWMTPADGRRFHDTPFDTADRVNYANVTEQARTAAALSLAALVRNEITETPLSSNNYARTIEGDVVWYDRKENVFVPEGIVPGDALVATRLNPAISLQHVRTSRMVFAERRIDPGTGRLAGPKTFRLGLICTVPGRAVWPRACAFDAEGNIVFASSEGDQAEKQYKTRDTIAGGIRIVTFPCRTLSIFSGIDAQHLTGAPETYVYALTGAAPRDFGAYHTLMEYATPPGQLPFALLDEGARAVFIMPDDRVRTVLGSSLFGARFALLGAPDNLLETGIDPDRLDDVDAVTSAEGRGYGFNRSADNILNAVTDGVVWHSAYKNTRDLWVLNELRLRLMTRQNIINLRADARHQAARDELLAARRDLRDRRYDRYLTHLRQAWGLVLRNYSDVRYTMADTVKGVVFYFALLLPFCFFMERLLFAFPDIRKRIVANAGIFLVVFLILRFVHPAFGLSRQPYVILLAFVMLIMALIVLFIVITRFAVEVRKMKTEAHGMYESDVGRLSATGAAVSLGVSNLRRRKVRTTLTVVTLTLITFLVSSLMTVKNKVLFWEIPRHYVAAYEGALFRNRNLAGMEKHYLEHLQSAFGEIASVFPRFWLHSPAWYPHHLDITRGDKSVTVNAALGITPEESELLDVPGTFLGKNGRNLTGAHDEVLLPDHIASLLGIDPDNLENARVTIAGRTMRVPAVFESHRMNAITDLDGDPILPNSPLPPRSNIEGQTLLLSETSSQEEIHPTERLDASRVILMSDRTVMEMEGILAGVSVRSFRDTDEIRPAVEKFLSRAGVNVFLSQGGNVSVLSSFGTAVPMAPAGLLVTIAIAALIVLNTMMGAVHERISEIDVYSSVGLAPGHVSALFFAESAVFATIGAVLGYLLGQVLATVVRLLDLDLGLSLNYSSLSAVLSTLIVMAVVMLSTWWPARIASARAVPDVSRKWRVPPPDGDTWTFEFPFTVGGRDILGLYQFLVNFFNAHADSSIGGFVAENVRLDKLDGVADEGGARGPLYRVSLTSWIAPFDLGISQEVQLDAVDTGEHNIFMVLVTIRRLSGDVDSWRRMNRGFLNLLRKRFLIWRAVPQEMKTRLGDEGMRASPVRNPSA